MISKVFVTGQAFKQACRYVCQDLDRSEVLAVDGVRGHDFRLMEKDFELQHQFTPEKDKPVFHGVLSFPHGEDPGDEKTVEIGKRYLEEIGMGNTQYAMIKHTDRAHLHVHILANRVNNDGKIIGQGMIIRRGIKAAQKLTREYALRQETGKNLSMINFEALPEVEAKLYRLYQAIQEKLPECQQFEDLEKRLLEKGITLRYRHDPKTHERVGISFRIENHSFKGSTVDASCSYRALERTLHLNQKQALSREFEQQQALKLQKETTLKLEKELKESMEKELRRGLEKDARKKHEDESEDQTLSLRHSHGLRHGM
jgi:hypothetical protein